MISARGTGSSLGGGVPQPELAGEKQRASEDVDEVPSRGDRGTRVGRAPSVLVLTPAGRTRAMSPFDSLVGTSLTPDPGPAEK